MKKEVTTLDELSKAWDIMSEDYDSNQERKIVFNYMREVSLQYLSKYFTPGMNVLELGCGTGDEAIYLAKKDINVFGTDISSKMVEYAKEKAEKFNLSEYCYFKQMPIENINQIEDVFDGAFSSFGPLNCISDINNFAIEINKLIRSGGYFIVSVMNKFSITEIIYYSLKLKFKLAGRRFGRKPVVVHPQNNPYSFECRYYTPRKFYDVFKSEFKLVEFIALPLFLLPFDNLEFYLGKHKKLFRTIIFIDKIFRNKPFAKSMGDHFLMVLKKSK